jgi:TolB protein
VALRLTVHRNLFVLAALSLFMTLGACQRFAQGTLPSPTPGPAQETPTTSPATSATNAVTNRIAYVGYNFDIYTITPEGTDKRRLTLQDGLYTWPIFSPNGDRVALSSFSADPLGPGKALYSVEISDNKLTPLFKDAPGAGPAIGPRIPHYGAWSPNSNYLAFLAMGEQDLSLYIVPGSGEEETRLVTSGSPLYLTWSGDSQSLLIHNGEDLLRMDMNAPGRLLNLEASSSMYRSPAWSPVSDSIAFLESQGSVETLYVARADGSKRKPVTRVQGTASFLWAPDGNRLAVGQSLDTEDPFLQDVRVIDVETAEQRLLVERPVMSFFWSPDGSKIAYVTMNNDAAALQWRVVDSLTGEDSKVVDFQASPDQLTLLAFFDQYVLSHQVWSPDSRHLVFSGTLTGDADEASQIFVVSVEAGALPRALARGFLATWSHQ